MSKKETKTEIANAIIKRLGACKKAEAEIVKRLRVSPTTAHFYTWRFEKTGDISKAPKRQKRTKHIWGAIGMKRTHAKVKKIAKSLAKKRAAARKKQVKPTTPATTPPVVV